MVKVWGMFLRFTSEQCRWIQWEWLGELLWPPLVVSLHLAAGVSEWMAWRHVGPSLLDFFWYSLILESIREPGHSSSKALSPTVFMIFMLVLIWWEFWVFWLSMRLQSQSLFLVSPSARGKSQVSRCIARSHAPFADYQQQWQWLAGRAPEDTENYREPWKEIQNI